jgi:uncharacterized protein YwqG
MRDIGMKPAIRIKTVKHKNSGKSFFGGLPKLPANYEWPFWDATPLYLDEIKYAEKTGRECGTADYWNSEIEKIKLLFGSPMEIQNPMEEMCQLCFHGFDHLEYDIDSDPEVAFLKDGVQDWQLLLQLDCDQYLDWEWGDSGMLYFWIRTQDLENRDFSNVWCEIQCT